MKRRSFLAMLGLAPVAAVAPSATAETTAGRVIFEVPQFEVDARASTPGATAQIRAAIAEYDRRILPMRMNQMFVDGRIRRI